MKSNIIKQTGIYAIGEIAPKILMFFLLPIYTHYLSPEDYGIVSYTNSVVIFLFALSALSLNSYVLRNYFEKKNETDRKNLIGNIYLFIGIFNLALVVVSFIITPSILEKYNIQVAWNPYFKLALISNFLEAFSIIPLVLYRVKQNAKLYVILSVSKTFLQFGITFLFIVVLKMGILGHFYGKLLSLIPFFFIYWYIIFKNAKINFNFNQIKVGLKFSLPLLPGMLAYLALGVSDRIILERHVNLAEIGIYNIAYTLAFSLGMVIQSVYKAIEPEIFKRYGFPDFNVFIKKTQSLFLFLVYSVAMCLSLFSQEVFKIMASPQYYTGYLLVPILVLGAIMTGQNVIYGGILQAEKNTKAIGFSAILGAIVSITFNLIFIPKWGIYAAAISSAISFFVMNIYLFIRMDFTEKTIIPEFLVLGLFMCLNFAIFYFFKIEFSYFSILIKIVALTIYIFTIAKIFKLDISNLKKYVVH